MCITLTRLRRFTSVRGNSIDYVFNIHFLCHRRGLSICSNRMSIRSLNRVHVCAASSSKLHKKRSNLRVFVHRPTNSSALYFYLLILCGTKLLLVVFLFYFTASAAHFHVASSCFRHSPKTCAAFSGMLFAGCFFASTLSYFDGMPSHVPSSD